VYCLPDCESTITFTLQTPLEGDQFAIDIGYPDGSVASLDCQPGVGSVACLPITSRIMTTFSAAGALESIQIADSPAAGAYAVQIRVGGEPAAAGTFNYAPTFTTLGSGGECQEPRYCASSAMFTIASP
jgi:hypothetical protein